MMRRPGASLAAAAPAGQRSPGPPVMRPVQPAAPGCIAMPAGATMMHAAQRHQPHHRCIRSRQDHEVPGHRSRTALRQAEGRRNAARCAAGSACSREVPNVASDATPRPSTAGQSRMPELMQHRSGPYPRAGLTRPGGANRRAQPQLGNLQCDRDRRPVRVRLGRHVGRLRFAARSARLRAVIRRSSCRRPPSPAPAPGPVDRICLRHHA